MAFEKGIKIKSVTIVPGDDYLGRVLRHRLRNFRPDVDHSPRIVDLIERSIAVSYAGTMAEKHEFGRHNWRGARSDMLIAWELAGRLHGANDKVLKKYMDYVRAWTEHFTKFWQWKIRAVAKRLLRDKELSSADVLATILEASERQRRFTQTTKGTRP